MLLEGSASYVHSNMASDWQLVTGRSSMEGFLAHSMSCIARERHESLKITAKPGMKLLELRQTTLSLLRMRRSDFAL